MKLVRFGAHGGVNMRAPLGAYVPTDPVLSKQPPEWIAWPGEPRAHPQLSCEWRAAARSYWRLLVGQELPRE